MAEFKSGGCGILKTAIFKKRRKTKVERPLSQKIVFCVFWVIFALYSLSMILPLLWGFTVSLKSQSEYSLNYPYALPENWLFVNYITAFSELNVKGFNVFGLIGNSLWFAFGSAILHIFICSMSAYILSRYRFPGSGTIYSVILVIMLLPIIGSLPSKYRLMSNMGLTDSPLYLVSCTGGIGFEFIVMHGFYKNLSWEYAEAAFVDGASHWRIFFQIMLPMTKGIISALIIIEFVGCWNDYTTAMIFFPNMPTLATGLFEYERQMESSANIPVYFAGLMISLVPVLTIFIIFQNTIMQSVSVGGLKG